MPTIGFCDSNSRTPEGPTAMTGGWPPPDHRSERVRRSSTPYQPVKYRLLCFDIWNDALSAAITSPGSPRSSEPVRPCSMLRTLTERSDGPTPWPQTSISQKASRSPSSMR